MEHLDKFEQLCHDTVLSVGILANAEGTDGMLVCGDLDEQMQRDLTARGLSFAGCIGLTAEGQPRTALAQPIEPDVINALENLFTCYVVPRFLEEATRTAQPKHEPTPQPEDGEVAWLENLFQLPDTRT